MPTLASKLKSKAERAVESGRRKHLRAEQKTARAYAAKRATLARAFPKWFKENWLDPITEAAAAGKFSISLTIEEVVAPHTDFVIQFLKKRGLISNWPVYTPFKSNFEWFDTEAHYTYEVMWK